VNPLVPADLDAVVLRCLRRLPKDRYKTAREVLESLTALEARARNSRPLKRRLNPLCVGALLGGVAAYVATIPPKYPPVTESRVPDTRVHPNLPTPEPALAVVLPPAEAPTSPTAKPQTSDTAPIPLAPLPKKRPLSQLVPSAKRATPTEPPSPVASATAASPQTTAPLSASSSEPLAKKQRITVWENPFPRNTNAHAGRGGL
jgi:serine/threonine protein kinase